MMYCKLTEWNTGNDIAWVRIYYNVQYLKRVLFNSKFEPKQYKCPWNETIWKKLNIYLYIYTFNEMENPRYTIFHIALCLCWWPLIWMSTIAKNDKFICRIKIDNYRMKTCIIIKEKEISEKKFTTHKLKHKTGYVNCRFQTLQSSAKVSDPI